MEEREGGGEFRSNCYHGNWKKLPADSSAVVADPLFANPHPADNLAATFRNYTLRSGSPCRARGLVIPDHGGRDLRGNRIPRQIPPDLGALQSMPSSR